MDDRVFYAGSVHDEAEIDAVVEVLRSGPMGMWPGRRVNAMERAVAALFGKQRGLMCNSGSSALYLAVELLDLPKGSEVVTAAVTFSTDVAPLVRAGLVPSFVDVETDTFQIDVDRIEDAVGPNTRAILTPNLIGNCPDWDAIRSIADRHDLLVVEDSADALGPTLRGEPTGTRSDLTTTSFASSHIITCAGNGGMVCLDSEELRDRGLLLRRWGRRSELHFFGSKRRDRTFWEDLDASGIDTRTVWTGNATRQPFLRGVEHRVPAGGLPNADAVMERGFVLPLNHALGDEHIAVVIDAVDRFLKGRGTGTTNGGTT